MRKPDRTWPHTRQNLKFFGESEFIGREQLPKVKAAFAAEDLEDAAWHRFRCQVHTWVAEVKESRGGL